MAVAEAWVPSVNRRRDLFGFADVAAVHPHLAGPLLVQVTTADDLADRSRMLRATAAARLWIRAGGRIELHGWSGGPAAGTASPLAASRRGLGGGRPDPG